jgi:hypothetical protein
VTLAASSKRALQVAPQLTPAGLEMTLPAPAPRFETVSLWVIGANDAMTEESAYMVSWQTPVPAHPSPDQPLNSKWPAGVAVRVSR